MSSDVHETQVKGDTGERNDDENSEMWKREKDEQKKVPFAPSATAIAATRNASNRLIVTFSRMCVLT